MAMKKDASQIKELLLEHLEEVAEELIPASAGGHREGGEWCADGLSGGDGQSCRMVLDGPNRGMYKEFAEGDKKGDVYCYIQDILSAKTGTKFSFRQALDWAENYLSNRGYIASEGISTHAESAPAKDPNDVELSWVFGDKHPEKLVLQPLSDETVSWFAEKRHISRQTLEEAGVCDGILYGHRRIVMPYFWPGVVDSEGNPKPVGAKVRNFENKKFFITPASESYAVPYGAHLVPPDARTIVPLEGEMDVLAMLEYGLKFPSVSVPMGANGQGAWVTNSFEWWQGFEKIIFAFDNDPAGAAGRDALIRRLGSHRCWIAKWPDGVKDANEALIKGIDINAVIDGAQRYSPPDLKLSTGYGMDALEKVMAYIETPDEKKDALLTGEVLPWQTKDQKIRLVSGHVTVWVGPEGTAKSKAALQNVAFSMTNGGKWCVASLEMPPEEYLAHFNLQMFGNEDYVKIKAHKEEAKAHIREIMPYIFENMTVYVRPEKDVCSMENILNAAEFSMRRYGTDHLLIDNFTNLTIDLDDYNGQKKAMDMLHDFAMDTQMQCHIVCHSRKTSSSVRGDAFPAAPPTNNEIFGSRSISALAQNIIAVWRNFPKEQFMTRIKAEGLVDKNGRPDRRLYAEEKEFKEDNAKYEEYLKAPDEILRTNKWRGDALAESGIEIFLLRWSGLCKRFERIDTEVFDSYISRFERIQKALNTTEGQGK